MKITNKNTIQDIQHDFSIIYPGLKLEFYKQPHEQHEASPGKEIHNPESKLNEIGMKKRSGQINVSPEITVADLESAFEEKFGLHVQVFRRSKELWLQTSTTDHWSLELQNSKGIHSLQS